tara:strand:+ start:271 stop:525 length:255 start_codon:yes stop_codon:yes gene_type:complete
MTINQSDSGKWVRLKGKSGHGKNRIREHGNLWLVAHVDTNKVWLRSRDKTFRAGGDMHHDNRWIDQGVDKNFEIVEVTNMALDS